jgi:hypothetical protein
MICSFCQSPEDISQYGKLLAFQSGRRQACAHENCIKYTTVVDPSEIEDSRMGHEYRNVFRALDKAKPCIKCAGQGATVGCSNTSCDCTFHVQCARKSGWNFEKRGKNFRCEIHRNRKAADVISGKETGDESKEENPSGLFQHNLLAQFGATPLARVSVPGNLDMGGTSAPGPPAEPDQEEIEGSSESDESFPGVDGLGIEVMDVPLTCDIPGSKRLVRVERSSRIELWNISIQVLQIDNSSVLSVAAASKNQDDFFSLQDGDLIVSINGTKIGAKELRSLRDVLFRLKQEVDVMLEVIRKK